MDRFVIVRALLTVLVVARYAPGEEPGEGALREELAKFGGRWRVDSSTTDGEASGASALGERFIVYEGNCQEYIVDGRGRGTGSIEVVAPGQFRSTYGDSPAKEATFEGLYEFAGDELRLCYNVSKKRPVKFESEAGSGNILIVLKRVRD